MTRSHSELITWLSGYRPKWRTPCSNTTAGDGKRLFWDAREGKVNAVILKHSGGQGQCGYSEMFGRARSMWLFWNVQEGKVNTVILKRSGTATATHLFWNVREGKVNAVILKRLGGQGQCGYSETFGDGNGNVVILKCLCVNSDIRHMCNAGVVLGFFSSERERFGRKLRRSHNKP